MTATRSWFIAFTIAYLIYFLFVGKVFSYKSLSSSFTVSVILIILFLAVPTIKNQINSAAIRLSTITAIAKGDITAEGTLKRYDVRAPKVIEGIGKSTVILGAGFSKLYLEYDDFHVGYHNILLNTGIVGFILILSFLFQFALRLYHIRIYQYLWAVPLIGLIMLALINAGSQTLGYNVTTPSRYLLQSVIFAFLVKTVSYSYYLKHQEQNA